MAAELIGAVFVGESLAYGCMKLGKAACGVLVGALGLLGKRKHTEDDRASPPASEGPAGAPSSQSTPAGPTRAIQTSQAQGASMVEPEKEAPPAVAACVEGTPSAPTPQTAAATLAAASPGTGTGEASSGGAALAEPVREPTSPKAPTAPDALMADATSPASPPAAPAAGSAGAGHGGAGTGGLPSPAPSFGAASQGAPASSLGGAAELGDAPASEGGAGAGTVLAAPVSGSAGGSRAAAAAAPFRLTAITFKGMKKERCEPVRSGTGKVSLAAASAAATAAVAGMAPRAAATSSEDSLVPRHPKPMRGAGSGRSSDRGSREIRNLMLFGKDKQFDKYPPRGEMADINSIVERELRAGGAAPDRGVRRRLARQLEAAGEQAPQAEQEEQAEQEDPPAPAAAASAPQGSGEERQAKRPRREASPGEEDDEIIDLTGDADA